MSRLFYIEILRFLASLSVLIFHYSFFFPKGKNQENLSLPFYNFLESIYYFGGSGVLVFWSISGYIFYHIYADRIIKQNISLKNFFIYRFSRLYPLHLLTLIIVVFLQIIHLNIFETFHHDYINDIYHFILNLFFVSFWGFEKSYSFNGPIWSVSVELIVYFFFFYAIFYFKKPFLIALSIIFICALIKIFSDTTYQLLNCLIFFFAGGLSYVISNYLDKKKINLFKRKVYYILLLILPYFFWKTELYEIKYFVYLFFLAYSSLLLLGASIDINLHSKFRKIIETFGNLTYGIYLFHFPVALSLKLIFHLFETQIPSNNNLFFLFYIFLVFGISYITFFKFERPIQKFIRNKFSNKNIRQNP